MLVFRVDTDHTDLHLENFKILQSTFTNHSVDKIIPVERLVKCRMQDNLEFLQWVKRFWEQYYNGDGYDAQARRGGRGKNGF